MNGRSAESSDRRDTCLPWSVECSSGKANFHTMLSNLRLYLSSPALDRTLVLLLAPRNRLRQKAVTWISRINDEKRCSGSLLKIRFIAVAYARRSSMMFNSVVSSRNQVFDGDSNYDGPRCYSDSSQ